MKICKNCNASNIDSVMFCLTCGKTDLVVLSNKFPWEDDVKEKAASTEIDNRN